VRLSKRRAGSDTAPEKLVVGLGNPGAQYASTRHNVGFLVLEELLRRHGLPKPARRYSGRLSVGRIDDQVVGLLAPQTMMNNSGRSVAAALRGLGLRPVDVLVVHDHIDLPFGRLRVSHNGGHGGHNGLRSLHELIGADFDRVRVGVDRPPTTDPDKVAAYVLSPFSEPVADVQRLIAAAADAVEQWLSPGESGGIAEAT
jgi:PTH1 family peptidyl-tRNA hydrolase